MNARNGKIARLPSSIRRELNERLDNAGEGPEILDWLNALPEVQEVLEGKFKGVPISKQNLSEWRQGGFQEWLLRRELCEQAEEMAELAEEMDGNSPNGELVDNVATVLAARLCANIDFKIGTARWMKRWRPRRDFSMKRLPQRGAIAALDPSLQPEHRFKEQVLREEEEGRGKRRHSQTVASSGYESLSVASTGAGAWA